jgi:two-component system nitrogen regulation response regulator GlnG
MQSVLKQALLQATGSVLVPDFLPAHVTNAGGGADGRAEGADGPLRPFIDERLAAGSNDLYAETLRRMEQALLTRVLQHTGGNQLRAASILGITRGSLRNKLRELGITIARTVEAGDDAED